ncbi:MAG: hypothetical protein JWO36_672 [Myxococcales bacterium]|nr:hypothetical protein [Myxococcales bacterium]
MSVRARLVGLAMVAGCAPAVTPPSETPVQTEPKRPAYVLAWSVPPVAHERPDLDVDALLPDVAEISRWPLAVSDHPELEPRFPIAAALATPGIGWLDLCSRGAQNRHVPNAQDQVAYLAAWCAVAAQDEEVAMLRLAPLQHSAVRGMPEAVRFDFASILVENGDADEAMRDLIRNQADRVEVLDLVAASYEHLGRPADARVINNHAIEIDGHPLSEAVRCHREARRIVLADAEQRPWALQRFEKTLEIPAGSKRIPDPTCTRIAADLACWVPAMSGNSEPACVPYARAHGIDLRQLALIDAYQRWPPEAADFHAWWAVALRAKQAVPLEGADLLAVIALESAFQAASCDSPHASEIGTEARRLRVALRGAPTRAALEPRLDTLIENTVQCARAGRITSP